MTQLSFAYMLDPSHTVQSTLRNWELMLSLPPHLHPAFPFFIPPPLSVSAADRQ